MSSKSQTHRRRANKLMSNHGLLAFIFNKEGSCALNAMQFFFR